MTEPESQAAALEAYLSRCPSLDWIRRPLTIYRALPGPYLNHFERASLQCLQSDKPLADELEGLGFTAQLTTAAPNRTAIVFATKHKEEVLFHIARAATELEEGDSLIVVAANLLGAPSLERRCREALGAVETYCKQKCRVIHVRKRIATCDSERLSGWLAAGSLQPVPETGLQAAPGLFSWRSIDSGSRLLSSCLPDDLAGRGADVGAGYGYLSREALQRASGITELHLIEAEHKALEAARINLADTPKRTRLHFHWADASRPLPIEGLDFIIMNPPFHASRQALPHLGRSLIRRALTALKPGGHLWMVANRHLPYEGELHGLSGTVRLVAQAEGFKVIEAVRSSSPPKSIR